MRRPDGTSRNYGFVTYESERTVEKCLVQLHWLAGRQVQVHRANPPNNANAGVGDRERDRGAGSDMRQGRWGMEPPSSGGSVQRPCLGRIGVPSG